MKSFEKRWAHATSNGLAILLTICFAFWSSLADTAKGKKSSDPISITLGAAADFAVRNMETQLWAFSPGTVNNHSGSAALAAIIVEERS